MRNGHGPWRFINPSTNGRTSVTGREVGHGPWRRLCAAAGRPVPAGRSIWSVSPCSYSWTYPVSRWPPPSSAAGEPATVVVLEPRSSMAFKVPLAPVARGGRGATHFPSAPVSLFFSPSAARSTACDAAASRDRAGRFPEPIERAVLMAPGHQWRPGVLPEDARAHVLSFTSRKAATYR